LFIFTTMACLSKKIILCTILITLIFAIGGSALFAQNTHQCDMICGKWLSTTKNLQVEIYKEGTEFRAKIIWFDDSDDKTRPTATRLDTDNPDPKLRTQTVVGSNVLSKLSYVPASNSWEGGIIYDALHGHYWDSAAYINERGELKVSGYWHFKFIGKTLTFIRTYYTLTAKPI
jgi:uncharacterized protein (DUF2147 family)